ncbi:hypothetical protein PtA15_14A136 [Puccinia triticina]|uniref:MAGE domain-containing protein n=1 Tax=Puccinia triticina TaxID=208348 RepID=A0ABY7D361_9BASI|nr:uncharacterized protein PtA15_14A136 [Puccinia triticina]WAQ91254.1 hypothetical protein PtA15_14A136 [Puccinia triticina]WAR62057.1 hypothetical protein PtB15_14B151 [Puccinia triticina]
MTPKRFLEIFLSSENSEVAFLRRLWPQPRGIDSTMRLLELLRLEVQRSDSGRERWSTFIQQQAVKELVSQEAPRGYYPRGSFHSSVTVKASFFTPEEQRSEEKIMTEEHMPFLHGLIFGMLQQRGIANDTSMANKDAREAANLANETSKDAAECEDFGEVAYIQELTGQDRVNARFARVGNLLFHL